MKWIGLRSNCTWRRDHPRRPRIITKIIENVLGAQITGLRIPFPGGSQLYEGQINEIQWCELHFLYGPINRPFTDHWGCKEIDWINEAPKDRFVSMIVLIQITTSSAVSSLDPFILDGSSRRFCDPGIGSDYMIRIWCPCQSLVLWSPKTEEYVQGDLPYDLLGLWIMSWVCPLHLTWSCPLLQDT